MINSESIKVGDIIKVNQNERLPVDLVLLYTTQEDSGNVFIRTDQLDGETDWKLRRAISLTQKSFAETKSFEAAYKSSIMYEPPS
jgi:phospholipid-translocating ATPase